jgi:mannan endo-1,4-beta-mannosidase
VQDVTYAVAGRYEIALTVWDGAGNQASESETIEVDAPSGQVDQHIYDDAMVAPWVDWSWATNYQLDATAPVHTGSHSIRFTPQNWEGLHFHDSQGLALAGYDRLSFWIDGGGAGGQKVLAALHYPPNNTTPGVAIEPYLRGGSPSVPQNGWAQVVIPLSAFNLAGATTIDGVILQDGSGTSQPDVWIDDVTIYPELGAAVAQPCAPLAATSGFVTRQGASLLLNGGAWRGAGADLYYLQPSLAAAQQMNDAASLRHAREALDDLVCLGMPVFRTLAFNEHTAAEDIASIQPMAGVYREEGLTALDQVIAEAKARNLRVVLYLANNWADYGGIPRYAQWAGKQHDDFFTDAQLQGWWKDYATMLLSRVNTYTGVAYSDEPTIIAWEIANELRCTSCVGTHTLATAVGDLATHLRSIAPNHLIGDGGEGFDDDPSQYPSLSNTFPVAGSQGASFTALGGLDALDLLSAHFYPANYGLNNQGDAQVWIDRHQQIAAAAGKVFYLGEYGFAVGDAQRAPLYDAWNQRLYQMDGAALGLVWQIMPTGMTDGQGFAIYYPGDSATDDVLWKWAVWQ